MLIWRSGMWFQKYSLLTGLPCGVLNGEKINWGEESTMLQLRHLPCSHSHTFGDMGFCLQAHKCSKSINQKKVMPRTQLLHIVGGWGLFPEGAAIWGRGLKIQQLLFGVGILAYKFLMCKFFQTEYPRERYDLTCWCRRHCIVEIVHS